MLSITFLLSIAFNAKCIMHYQLYIFFINEIILYIVIVLFFLFTVFFSYCIFFGPKMDKIVGILLRSCSYILIFCNLACEDLTLHKRQTIFSFLMYIIGYLYSIYILVNIFIFIFLLFCLMQVIGKKKLYICTYVSQYTLHYVLLSYNYTFYYLF